MSSFPLLRLPSLALIDSLKCLDPIELFTLSQCSKKMIEKVRLAGTRKFHLSLDFGSNEVSINSAYQFEVIKNSSKDDDGIYEKIGYRNFSSNEETVTVQVALNSYSKNFLASFWDDKFIGLRTICYHLSKIFGCKIDSFVYDFEYSPEQFQSIINEILEKQGEINSLSLERCSFTDNDLKWALDNVKVTEKLDIEFVTSPKFEYNFKRLPKILLISYSPWVTLNHLLSLDSCVVISLSDSNLTNQDLSVFMDLWKIGNYKKLEYLDVRSGNLNDEEPIAGLTEMKNTSNYDWKGKRIDKYYFGIYGGVDIQGDNGVMGTLNLEGTFFQFFVQTK